MNARTAERAQVEANNWALGREAGKASLKRYPKGKAGSSVGEGRALKVGRTTGLGLV